MRSRACLPLLLVVALAAGCGGEEKEKPKGAVKTFAAGAAGEGGGQGVLLHARARAHGRRPEPIRIELDNEGTLAHNLKVIQGGRDLGGTPTFAPKGTRGGSVKLAPGKYRMVCTVANHEQLGMVGDLEVTR